MKIVLGSAFRNSAGRQIDRYFSQARTLRNALEHQGHSLFVVASEGDSSDNTPHVLDVELTTIPGKRVTYNHGGPWFGSTEAPERFKALQGVGNSILEAVPDDAGILIYVESDLIWSNTTLLALLDRVLVDGLDVVSPLVFAGEAFYDIFAFRKSGSRFGPFPPFHPELNGLTEVDSTGSCLVMKADVARKARVSDHNGLVGFCDEARSKGFHVWVDPDQRIFHP